MIPLKLGTLESVDLRQIWLDEARDFTPWLAQQENLELLSDALSLELEFEGIEIPVGPYKVDIVAKEALTEFRAVIENQLERTDHDHLGKVICYAAGLQAKIVIWIAREFTEEHRQAIDFLNQTGSGDLRLYAVQVRLLRIGDSLPAPHFEIVSSPNEYLDTVKKDQGTPSALGALYLEFWESFREFCLKQRLDLKLRKPTARQYYSLSIGRSKFSLALDWRLRRLHPARPPVTRTVLNFDLLLDLDQVYSGCSPDCKALSSVDANDYAVKLAARLAQTLSSSAISSVIATSPRCAPPPRPRGGRLAKPGCVFFQNGNRNTRDLDTLILLGTSDPYSQKCTKGDAGAKSLQEGCENSVRVLSICDRLTRDTAQRGVRQQRSEFIQLLLRRFFHPVSRSDGISSLLLLLGFLALS
jgi:hypothetical protein